MTSSEHTIVIIVVEQKRTKKVRERREFIDFEKLFLEKKYMRGGANKVICNSNALCVALEKRKI